MRFKIHTLIDITKTNARRGDDQYAWKQQQNYNTLLGVISLRVNPSNVKDPVVNKIKTDNLGFGKKFKNKQNVWTFEFDVEYEGSLDKDMLMNDFDLIPFVDQLDETVDFNTSVFITRNNNITNIIFDCEDK